MKLCGLELIDCDKANKFVKIINKSNEIAKDFSVAENLYVPQYAEFSSDWSENIFLITLLKDDDKYQNYITFIDLDDGYRSESGLISFVTDTPASVNMQYYDINVTIGDIDNKDTDYDLVLYYKDEVLFASGTDVSDSYYPCGICDYNPEILNK
ncbi:MAG: hypothetical protein J6T10_04465 [Methanobrevibacter sp.]|nr:hypothetical protein [Methanobrevibacter sp.]